MGAPSSGSVTGPLLAACALVAHAQTERLHLYNWNNYITAETLAHFERACRCRVVQDYYAGNE